MAQFQFGLGEYHHLWVKLRNCFVLFNCPVEGEQRGGQDAVGRMLKSSAVGETEVARLARGVGEDVRGCPVVR